MKKAKNATKSVMVKLIEQRETQCGSYLLLCICVEGAREHLIYVSNGVDESICTTSVCERQSRLLFELIVRLGASPIHLREIVEDTSHAHP